MCMLKSWSLPRCRKKPDKNVKNKMGIDREMVQQAGAELRQAYQVLSRVEDSDMVDYAVFTLNAAEKRYGYLLRKLKEEEIQVGSYSEENKRAKIVKYQEG